MDSVMSCLKCNRIVKTDLGTKYTIKDRSGYPGSLMVAVMWAVQGWLEFPSGDSYVDSARL